MASSPSRLWIARLLPLLLAVCFTQVKGDATSDLAALEKEFFNWQLRQTPEFSTTTGVKTYNDLLNDYSLDVFDQNKNDVQQFLQKAQGVDRSQLSRQHQYSYDILLDVLNTFLSNYPWRFHGPVNPVNFMEGFYLDLASFVSFTPFDDKKDFENYVARLEAWPTQINQLMDRMDKAIEMGTTNHNVSMLFVPGQLSKVTAVASDQSVLYKALTDKLTNLTIDPQEKETLRTRGRSAVEEIWSNLNRLKTYVESTYLPRTRSSYGVLSLPSGRENYRACLKWHLSVDLSPEEVHQKGLKEVHRISQLMQKVMTKQAFNGTIKEFNHHLREDPRFKLSSREEILEGYENIIFNRTYPKLPKLFKNIPPGKIVVKPLSFDGPYGMYMIGSEDGKMPGTFFVNLFRPNETRTFSMVSLTLHEAVPGHHLQGIYQLNATLPGFQKHIAYPNMASIPYAFPIYTAYTEGWGLYAEYLGEEMGVYANDYEMMGRYGDEIFRACRLVVDTGIHYKGWSREKAIQYMSARIPMSAKEVELEIDRYITWPGQACAYKIGELKIKELRQKATKQLGSKFDIRDFHSLLLTNGPMPLSVMETIVNDYITDQLTGSAARHSGSIFGTCLLALLMWALTLK